MSEKNDLKNGSVKKQDHIDVPMEASENKNRKKRRIITFGLIAVLLICIGLGCVFLFSPAGVFSPNAQVKVTFDSTGGSAVENQTVQKGEKLNGISSPSREGYVFAGWFYEEAPVNAYNENDVFSQDTKLYAAWYEPDMTVDKAEYIKDCDSNISFTVRSKVALTEDNLAGYIGFSAAGVKDGKTLSVKQQDADYVLYSKDGFTPGFTYSIRILDTKAVSFLKAGEDDVSGAGITSYNFTIYRENENNVVSKAKPKLLSSADVSSLEAAGQVAQGETGNENDNGKTIYRATLTKQDGDYKPGDIISLGSGEEDARENKYYKVCKVTNDDTGFYLDLIAPNMDEIYSDFEVYYSGDAASFVEDKETADALEQDLQTSLKESKGYDYLCTSIARSIKQSPTLLNTVSKLAVKNQKRFEDLSISALTDLLKNVRFDISFGKTQDIANNDNGCFGKISFTTGDVGISLAENINLTLNLTMSEDITSTAYGWQKLDGGKLYLDNGTYINNIFTMSFSAVIATDSGTVNITDEIQNLIDSQSDDKTQTIVDSLNSENLFGDDLDYIEILSKELGERTVDIYDVLSIQFKLNFKVSLGMRAGLNLNFSSTELRKIGMCNVDYSSGQMETSKMNYYNERMRSEIHFTAILKGQMGIRAGFEASVNFSVLHLNDYLNFGFAAELGVYEEISGYLRFDYDYTKSSGNSDSSMSLAGGLKSETGIYVGLSFTWNVFGYEDSVSIAEMKFPILTIGALEFASEFKEPESAITINTNTYNIKNSDAGLLDLKYVDISGGANGVTINIRPASLSGDYAFFLLQDKTGKGGKDNLNYVSLDKGTGMITIADNAPERIDFTVVVQYTKGCSLFSKDLTPITKDINFTYMKYKVDNSSQKYKAVFYMPDGSVLQQSEYYVGQIPVPPAEETYESLLLSTKYKVKDWSKPWEEGFAAIYENTDYHLDCELNYKNITFYGNVYNETTGRYQYGVIATVPTLVGDVPVPPSPGDMDMEQGWQLDGWSPALRAVDADYGYTAVFRQGDDVCWTSFYLDDSHRISAEFVKKGAMPNAPDMSQYNTDERQFAGWWPTLHASTNNSETYFAVFRQKMNVTFKDREGKVLSEQRVWSGTTPEAPEIDDVAEGEEDYYEYHFRNWASEDGSKLGPVYGDTVYTAKYDKRYLEVTTTFDAGGHTFADGTKTKVFKGTYAAYNFLYLPQATYRDNENTYTVDYWQSAEKVNGSYVKLYMSGIHTDYKYNVTFRPVFKKGAPVVYTVRFDGGDETVYLTGHYGDVIASDMLKGLKKTSTISNYVYELSDYGLALPYRFGTVTGADGLPADYISVKAIFKEVGLNKTFTFDANGGKFADNKTTKTVTAPYGSKASFNETPVKTDDDNYTYTFAGWAYEKDATSGSSFSDFIINGDSTLYAVYSKALRDYTITFDAGAGHFTDGKSTAAQTYHYGNSLALPGDPARDETATYRYVFIGWQPVPTAGTPVTANRTYAASYRTIRKDGMMDIAGITVSDGTNSEDISVGSIPGYTYGFVGAKYIPTLTVTGNGLTFGGTSGEVCVVIGTGVTSVTLNNLNLSGAYSDVNGVLVTAETTGSLTVNISGTCVVCNTQNGEPGARFERPVLFAGAGTGAKLSISAKGCYNTVYCGNTFSTDSLELGITAQKREGDEGFNVTTISNDGASSSWLFKDSTIRLDSQGTICEIMSGIRLENSNVNGTGKGGALIMGDMLISGASVVNMTAAGENAAALSVDNLIFNDFTGSFGAFSTNPTSPGVAVRALSGIAFMESGVDVGPGGYDLGGTQIGSFIDEASGTPYTSFGIDGGGTLVPVPAVSVNKAGG